MLALMPLLAMPELVDATVDLAAAEIVDEHAADDHGESFSLVAGLPGWQATLITLGAIAFVVVGGSQLTRPLFRFISMGTFAVNSSPATALMIVIGIALLMTLVGLSPALGTFMAGVVVG